MTRSTVQIGRRQGSKRSDLRTRSTETRSNPNQAPARFQKERPRHGRVQIRRRQDSKRSDRDTVESKSGNFRRPGAQEGPRKGGKGRTLEQYIRVGSAAGQGPSGLVTGGHPARAHPSMAAAPPASGIHGVVGYGIHMRTVFRALPSPLGWPAGAYIWPPAARPWPQRRRGSLCLKWPHGLGSGTSHP